jgi:hypothetical protein
MGSVELDTTKRVFLAPSCIEDKKTLDHILKVLERYKAPQNKIIKELDMDILASGDYLVRYRDEDMQLFKIELTLPFGYTTRLIGIL